MVKKRILNSTKHLILGEYSSFVEKFGNNDVSYDEDWVSFLTGFYKLPCRENLFTVFKWCCLRLKEDIEAPPPFSFALPGLSSGLGDFESCVQTVQTSLSGIPNVTGLFNNPRTIVPIFSLLGRRTALFEDTNFSVWDVTSSCPSRRHLLPNRVEARFICTGLNVNFYCLCGSFISDVHLKFFGWVRFCSGEEISSCIHSSCYVCYDEMVLKYIVTCIPEGWRYYFSLEDASYRVVVQIRRTQNKLLRFLSHILTF